MRDLETPSKDNLSKILTAIDSGFYVIPDFQREFEWGPWDIQALLQSIFADYYIGTLLLWRSTPENFDKLNCESIYGFNKINKEKLKYTAQHIVLDGQQRLSALHYAFFPPTEPFPKRKTRFYFFVKLNSILEDDWDESIEYRNDNTSRQRTAEEFVGPLEKQFEEGLFPLYLLGQGFEWYKWVVQYGNWLEKQGDTEKEEKVQKLEKFFQSLLNSYDISYIELSKDIDVAKVCDIFTKINSSGLKLTIFDLLNALLKPHDIELKKNWRIASENYNHKELEKMNIYLLQYMSIRLQGYCSPRYLYYLVPNTQRTIRKEDGSKEKRVIMTSPEEFTQYWEEALQYTQKALAKIENPRDFGSLQPKFIPYPTMTPILAVLLKEKESLDSTKQQAFDKKITQWYWASVLSNSYSSSVESTMTKDYLDLKKWIEDDSMTPNVVQRAVNTIENLDLVRENRQNTAIYNAIFSLFARNEARDFYTNNLPEYSVLEDHHIVPASWGKKNGIKDINTILNKAPISNDTNKKISDRLPSDYLNEIKRNIGNDEQFYDLMRTHLLSRKAIEILTRENFGSEDFNNFIQERKKTIINELRSIFEGAQKETILITPQSPYTNTKHLKDIIKAQYGEIKWVDKYFSVVGLDLISESISESSDSKISSVKIITSINKVDHKIREKFKTLKEELNYRSINAEMRVILDSELKNSLHDRWLITESGTYNIPSTDTLRVGQYSEIKKTDSQLPFSDWWNQSLDIILDWNRIEQKLSEMAIQTQ